MRYQNTVEGRFIRRPNRFVAIVEINGEEETVHVKNTGRCQELLVPGARVILEKASNPERKTKYDLIQVYREYGENKSLLFNMDSQAPNVVVGEWLSEAEPFGKNRRIIPEYTFGKSRIDFYVETEECRKILLEVKGVTLEKEGWAYFPDAPTQRGLKHIYELIEARKQGFEAVLAFVVQAEEIDGVSPNEETQPEFGKALREAREAGVKLLCLGCRVGVGSLWINRSGVVRL